MEAETASMEVWWALEWGVGWISRGVPQRGVEWICRGVLELDCQRDTMG